MTTQAMARLQLASVQAQIKNSTDSEASIQDACGPEGLDSLYSCEPRVIAGQQVFQRLLQTSLSPISGPPWFDCLRGGRTTPKVNIVPL